MFDSWQKTWKSSENKKTQDWLYLPQKITSSVSVSFSVSVSSSAPIWGSDVSITCNVTPWPLEALVRWTLNDSPFEPQNGAASNTRTAAMEKATGRLTGNWTCVVNYKGQEGRASATLSVQGKIQEISVGNSVWFWTFSLNLSLAFSHRGHPPTQRRCQGVRCCGICGHAPLCVLPRFDPLWSGLGETETRVSYQTRSRSPPCLFLCLRAALSAPLRSIGQFEGGRVGGWGQVQMLWRDKGTTVDSKYAARRGQR